MPEACNERKNDFLGMKFGTASHRLRKQLLFKYVRMAGHDTCYRCGKLIDNADEFTVDHKDPWLYENSELFWDLDNIAFSHKKCNVQHKRYTRERGNVGGLHQRKMLGDELWCNKCKRFLDGYKFSDNKYTWNGKQKQCISCRSVSRRKN